MQNVIVPSADSKGVSVVCSNCGEVLQVSNSECIGKAKAELLETGEQLVLTYVSCDKCGGRSYVQVDNDKTIDRLETVQRLLMAGKKKFAKKLDAGLHDMRRELKLRVEGRDVGVSLGDGGEREQITLELVM